MTRPLPRVAVVCVLAVGLAACAPATTGVGAPTAGLAVATAPPPDSADPDEDDADAATPHEPVSANSAPQDEIVEALQDAGVTNPGRWAKEVVAHRPYPADDPKLTRLRAALAPDNPGPGTVDNIVGALKP